MNPPRMRLPRGTLLLLAAHPDDECLGAGGVLALQARSGGGAAVAFATDGEAGGPSRGPALAARRRIEARAACRRLGAACEFWGLADGGLAREPRLAAFAAEAVRRYQPALLLRPAFDDPHPDHRALALAAERFPGLSYEVTGPAKPDVLVDIGAVEARKLAALACHQTQERRHRWTAFAARRARALALLLPGAEAAEGFRYTSRHGRARP